MTSKIEKQIKKLKIHTIIMVEWLEPLFVTHKGKVKFELCVYIDGLGKDGYTRKEKVKVFKYKPHRLPLSLDQLDAMMAYFESIENYEACEALKNEIIRRIDYINSGL